MVAVLILGMFTKLRKVTASSCVSVCQSVCMEQIGSNRMDFCRIPNLRICRKSVDKI